MDEPLTGNVYLRGNNGRPAACPTWSRRSTGAGSKIDVVGKIDSRLGGLRASFDVLPDAPVTKFTMTLHGGEQGLIANATNVCAFPQVATAKFIGQDNAIKARRIQVKSTSCGGRRSR